MNGKSRLWWLGLALFILVLTFSAAHRFAILKSHFAHFDDIGVAATIIGAETTPPPLPFYLRPEMFPFIAVPLYWTYAPLPFVATPFLIAADQSYESVKFWGRLPSLVFTLGAILLMVAVAFRLERSDAWALATMMAVPLAFSREFTIMAAQMHPYAAAAAAATALIWLTLYDTSLARRKLGSVDKVWKPEFCGREA